MGVEGRRDFAAIFSIFSDLIGMSVLVCETDLQGSVPSKFGFKFFTRLGGGGVSGSSSHSRVSF